MRRCPKHEPPCHDRGPNHLGLWSNRSQPCHDRGPDHLGLWSNAGGGGGGGGGGPAVEPRSPAASFGRSAEPDLIQVLLFSCTPLRLWQVSQQGRRGDVIRLTRRCRCPWPGPGRAGARADGAGVRSPERPHGGGREAGGDRCADRRRIGDPSFSSSPIFSSLLSPLLSPLSSSGSPPLSSLLSPLSSLLAPLPKSTYQPPGWFVA